MRCHFGWLLTIIMIAGSTAVNAAPEFASAIAAAKTSSATIDDDFTTPRNLLSGQTKKQGQILPATQAFRFSALQDGNQVIIQARVTPNHYLYQQNFSVQGSAGLTVGRISFDEQPEFEQDPEFGRVPVFHRDVSLTVPVQGSGELILNWQGCAKASVCYPPEQFKTQVLAHAKTVQAETNKKTDGAMDQEVRDATERSILPHPKPAAKSQVKVTALGENPAIVATPLPEFESATDAGALVQEQVPAPVLTDASVSKANPANSIISDPFGLADHALLAFGLLFLAGLGLAFTPCVLPMLPIVANLVATQHRRSVGHGFLLAASYAVGVACSYAVLGALVALFGHQLNLIAWSQHPAILISFAAIFIALALHSFEVFELRLPAFIRGRMQKIGQYGQAAKWSGSILGCWVAGFFSALIVSPCLSAPLAGVLLSVSTVGNPWLGAVALFCLGLGLGVPLMILGATEGRFLPQAGNWLNWVRRGFGLLLFGVALVLLNRVFNSPWMLILWAVLSLFFALWLWYWAGRGHVVTRALSVLVGIWAVLQVIGAGIGATDPVRPLAPLVHKKVEQQPVAVIYTVAQLKAYQQQYPYLLVELSADWCIACKVIERELFLQNPAPELDNWTRVKLDVTQTNADSRAVLQQLNVFGPPALMLYQNGQLVEQLLGEPGRDEFSQVLRQHTP
ncbi:protein-disulfide reductase DsbD [Alkanindiges sp. WGS2144]|uniref:protein-disulfide reductase DsbD n=1 Tax=Alkanindiges sp. WGS2144 TaxID=3366808 RepID=UPI0037537017